MKDVSRSTIARIAAVVMIFALVAGATPALAARALPIGSMAFDSRLEAAPPTSSAEKITKQLEPIAKVTGDQPATRAKAPETRPAQPRSAGTSAGSTRSSQGKSESAQAILASYKARYPILQGVTVQFGNARGFQAIAYYKSGRIVICPNHDASLERIINHEVWHIIDWRDNNRIDWGENIPPKNAESYAR